MELLDHVIDHVIKKFNQKAQKRFYPYLTRRLGADDVLFLDWAYEENQPMALSLDPADEPNRYPIQLYHSTATQAGELAGKTVLEVGCGHGGGASYLTRSLRPASYTGLDLNPAGIEFCRQRHQVPGLQFVQGNAENLPFTDGWFHAVINIESSHCYQHFDRFLREVARVLRPGGHFLYADMRPVIRVADWEAALASAPMRMLSQRDIGVEVVRGMEKNSPQIRAVVDRLMPALQHRLACAVAERLSAPVRGSMAHRDLRVGRIIYRMYCLSKP